MKQTKIAIPSKTVARRLALAVTIAGLSTAMLVAAHSRPALADGVVTGSCVGGWGGFACTRIYRQGVVDPNVINLRGHRDEREEKAAEQRDRHWADRCRPVVQYDDYGVGRYRYAARGCEFGRAE